ncbi:MAG: oligopeptide transporter, OPT family, partial [Xanthomonas perforans]|nr:oligopeptide transporter, OPT family [Xanthomonas perforans]
MSHDAQPRQLTFRAVVLAIVLAVVLSAANAYLGLFAGLTIATAIPAAVVSMGVLRLLGGGTILENNIVQTGASAGSSIAAGVIFTIPALVIMGYWPDFKYWWVLGIAGMGGLLGVLFSVPLRRSMIVEDPLPFPEGKAAAEVLKAGENPGPGLKILAMSGAIGALVKLGAASGLRVIPDTWAQATYLGSSRLVGYLGTNLSPALLGVGYIVGLNVGIVVLSGSILSWHIAIPLYQQFFMGSDPALAQSLVGAPAADAAFGIWGAKIRYLGVGAMLIGGVWTLFSLRKSLLSGVKSGFAAARKSGGGVVAETERDLPMKWMLAALVLCTLPLLGLYQAIVQQWHVSIPMTIIMIVAGFLFVSVSGYLAGLIGSSNNPVSGITISTILFASAVLVLLLGKDGLVP